MSLLSLLRRMPLGAKLQSRQLQVILIYLGSLAITASIPFLIKNMIDSVSAGNNRLERWAIGIAVAVVANSILTYINLSLGTCFALKGFSYSG